MPHLGDCPEILYGNQSFLEWPESGDCYVRLKTGATYEEAEALCANISSRLLSIRSFEEQQWVYNTFVNQLNPFGAEFPIWVWLGAKVHLTPWIWPGKSFNLVYNNTSPAFAMADRNMVHNIVVK